MTNGHSRCDGLLYPESHFHRPTGTEYEIGNTAAYSSNTVSANVAWSITTDTVVAGKGRAV